MLILTSSSFFFFLYLNASNVATETCTLVGDATIYVTIIVQTRYTVYTQKRVVPVGTASENFAKLDRQRTSFWTNKCLNPSTFLHFFGLFICSLFADDVYAFAYFAFRLLRA